MNKPFLKFVAAILIFTFSFSNLLYAADPRDLLNQAKAAFDLEDQRRTGSGDPLGGGAGSAVNQQNNLQDLQNMNFSMTTQNGDVLKYVGNKLDEVERPDGTLLRNITLDVDGKIQNADLKLLDGSIQVYQNGGTLGYQTPDGTQIVYENGQIKNTSDKNGVLTSYTYTKDAQGKIVNTILESPSTKTTYDAQGRLQEVLQKTSGQKMVYLAGILQKIMNADGSQINFQSQILGSQTQVTFKSYLDPAGNLSQGDAQYLLKDGSLVKDIVWDLAKVKNATLQSVDGNIYFFINGAVNSINLLGGSSLQNVIFDSLGNLNSANFTDAFGNKVDYSAGAISAMRLSDGTLIAVTLWGADGRAQNATLTDSLGNVWTLLNGNFSQIKLKNGGVVSNIAWDSQNNIKDCIFTDAQNNIFTIQSGAVVSITSAQGTVFKNIIWDSAGFLQSASWTDVQGTQWTLSNNSISKVNFSDGTSLLNPVWDAQGKFISGTWVDVQGNKYDFVNGQIATISLLDGCVLQNLMWDPNAGKLLNALLTDFAGNQYTFINSVVTQIRLVDGSILTNISWTAAKTIQNALLTTPAGNKFTISNGAAVSAAMANGWTLQGITWNPDGSVQNALLTGTAGNQFTFVAGLITQIKLTNNFILTNITWDASGNLSNALLTDTQNNLFTFVSGQATQVKLADGSIFTNIAWDAAGKMQSALLTDTLGNQFTFVNGVISQIKLVDGTVLTALTFDAAGKIQNAILTDLQNNQFIFTNGVLGQVKLLDGSTLSAITWSSTGTLQNGLLSDAQGNQFIFVNGVITQVKLADGSTFTGISWATDNTIASATLTATDGSKCVYVNKQLTQFISPAGVLTNYGYTASTIVASCLGVAYEYLLDKSLNRVVQVDGSYSLYNTAGPYKGLRSQDVSATGLVSLYEYQTTGGIISVQKRDILSSIQAVTSGAKITISDKNNAYQPASPLLKADFNLASTASSSSVALTAIQAKSGNITRTLTFSFQSGKWTLTRSDLDSSTNRTTTSTVTIAQVLAAGQPYTAELRLEGTKANLYIYAAGQARSLTPTGSLDAFAVSTKLTGVFNSTAVANYQIQNNLQAPAISALSGPTLTTRTDALKNLTLTKRALSVTKKTISITQRFLTTLVKPIPNVAKKDLSGVQKPALSVTQKGYDISKPILSANKTTLPAIITRDSALTKLGLPFSKPVFSLQKIAITLTKPSFLVSAKTLNLTRPSSAVQGTVSFTTLLYDVDGSLTQVLETDGATLNFSKGLLTSAIDAKGNVVAFDFSQTSIGNILGSNITQNGLVSTFDEAGNLSTIKINDEILHYKKGSTEIDFIEKSDGTRVSQIVFDVQGAIKDAVVTAPDGSLRIYQSAKMIQEKKLDGTVTDYINGLPSVTHMTDGRVYTYLAVTPGADSIALKSFLIQYSSADGSVVYLSAGTPTRIERKDGSVLTDLKFDALGNLTDATVAMKGPLGENLTAFYKAGVLTSVLFPDGKTFFYSDGYLQKISKVGAYDVLYSYVFDSSGKPSQFMVKDSEGTRVYDENGNLIRYQNDDIVVDYQGSVLKKISYAGVEINNPQFDLNGNLSDGLVLTPDGNQYSVKNSAIEKVTRPDGTQVFYSQNLISEVKTVQGKDVKYIYSRDSSGNLVDVKVSVDSADPITFGEYLLDPSRKEETPVKQAASDYNVLFNPSVVAFANLSGARSVYVNSWPGTEDSTAVVTLSLDRLKSQDTTHERTGFKFYFGSSYKSVFKNSFYYLKLKQNGMPNLKSLHFGLEASYEPGDLAGVSQGFTLGSSYQALTVPITADFKSVTNAEVFTFDTPLSVAEQGSISIAQAANYTISSFDPSEYTRYVTLTKKKIDYLTGLPAVQNYSSLLSGAKIAPSFNHQKEALTFAIELDYDKNYALVSSKRSDNSISTYGAGKVSAMVNFDGSSSSYVYENGQIKTITNKTSSSAADDTVTNYQYGKIRSVTKKDGTVLYSYTYEIDSQSLETTVIQDVATGEIKRYQAGKLISSQNPNGMITLYTYDGERISESSVQWQGKEMSHFRYRYDGVNTLITDETGVTKTYDGQQKLIYIETASGLKYRYNFLHDDNGDPVEEQALYSAAAGEGVTLFYKDDTVTKISLKDGTVLNVSDQDPNLYQKVLLKQGLVDQVFYNTGELATYIRDDRGNLQFVDVAKNGQARRYTADGLLVRVLEASGVVREYGYLYDDKGNIDKVRVVKKTPKMIGDSFGPLSATGVPINLAADSGGYDVGWNASIYVDDKGAGKFNYNFWRNPTDPWYARGFDIAIVDAQGKVVKNDLFDVYGKGSAESDRMAAFLETVPQGYFAVMALGDEGSAGLTERALKAIESFGSGKIRTLGFRNSFALIGKKGGAIGSAIEDVKSDDYVFVQSYTTDYFYYDKNQNSLSYDQFTTIPKSMLSSSIQDYVGDSAEVFATTGFGAAGFRKNFNALYPESGFVRLWNNSSAGYYAVDDKYVSDLLALTKNAKDKVVYYDSRYPSNYIRKDQSLALKDKLVAQGFKVIDADQLYTYLTTQGSGGVVVMAQDIAPDTIYDPNSVFSISHRTLAADYMKNGGSMVWMGDTPFFYVGKPDGSSVKIGEIGYKRMLGVTPVYRPIPIYKDSTEAFDSAPSGWTLSAPNVSFANSKMILTVPAGSAIKTEAYPNSFSTLDNNTLYSIDFSCSTLNSGFQTDIEGEDSAHLSAKLWFKQVNGRFEIGYSQGAVVTDSVQTVSFAPGVEYTADFDTSTYGIKVFIYQKGTKKPTTVTYYLSLPNFYWQKNRVHFSILNGSASISEMRTRILTGTSTSITATRLPVFTATKDTQALDPNILHFDTNVNYRTIRWDKVKESIGYALDSDTAIVSDYNKNGDLISLAKADRTVTFYENNQVQLVTDINGFIMVEYAYDATGNLTSISDVGQRREVDNSILNSKDQAQVEKIYNLEDLGIDQGLVNREAIAKIDRIRSLARGSFASDIVSSNSGGIFSMAVQAAIERRAQNASTDPLQKTLDEEVAGDPFLKQVADAFSQFGKARRQAQDAVDQITSIKTKDKKSKKEKSSKVEEVYTMMRQIDEQEQAYYESVSKVLMNYGATMLQQRKDSLEADYKKSFDLLDAQKIEFGKKIQKQEAAAVISHYYRSVLGRDATQTEITSYDAEVEKNGVVSATALSVNLRNSSEFIQRTNSVAKIRGQVEGTLDDYLNGDAAKKSAVLKSLGLDPSEVVTLSAQDVQKIKDFLRSQSLHFAGSAIDSLMELLKSKGITPDRSELATKLILVDIFSGIIHPYLKEGEEMLISLYSMKKVASLYGFSADGLNLSYDDLLTLFNSGTPQAGRRVLLYTENVHYTTLTKITATQVTLLEYTGDTITLSKEDFLKTWKGSTLVEKPLSASVISNDAKKSPTARVLSDDEARKIKGGCFFLIPMIIGAISSIMAAIGGILAAIGGLIAQIGVMIGQVLNGLGTLLYNAAQSLGGIVKGIWSGIKFVGMKLFTGFAKVFAPTLAKAAAGEALKVSVGQAIFNSAIRLGISYAVSKGLDALGVNPVVSSLITAFVTGGIQGGFTNLGFDFGSFLSSGIKATLQIGVQHLMEAAGLDSQLSSLLSLTTGPLVGGIWNGNINGAITTIAPKLASGLAVYGLGKLGTSLGIDPRLTNLIGAPISSALNVGLQAGGATGTQIIEAVNKGFQSGVVSLGIEYATKSMDPLLGSLTARAITGAIEGALPGGAGVFGGIYQAFHDSALNIARLGVSGDDEWSQAQYLQRAINFTDIIKQKGLAQAIEETATQVMTEDSIDSILKITNPLTRKLFGSVAEYLGFLLGGNVFQDPATQGKMEKISAEGVTQQKITYSNGDYEIHALDANGKPKDLVEIKKGNQIIHGTFGEDLTTNFSGLKSGTVATYDANGKLVSKQYIQGGWDIEQDHYSVDPLSGKEVLDLTAKTTKGKLGIAFDGFGNYRDADIEMNQLGYTFTINDGNIGQVIDDHFLSRPSSSSLFLLGGTSLASALGLSSISNADLGNIYYKVQREAGGYKAYLGVTDVLVDKKSPFGTLMALKQSEEYLQSYGSKNTFRVNPSAKDLLYIQTGKNSYSLWDPKMTTTLPTFKADIFQNGLRFWGDLDLSQYKASRNQVVNGGIDYSIDGNSVISVSVANGSPTYFYYDNSSSSAVFSGVRDASNMLVEGSLTLKDLNVIEFKNGKAVDWYSKKDDLFKSPLTYDSTVDLLSGVLDIRSVSAQNGIFNGGFGAPEDFAKAVSDIVNKYNIENSKNTISSSVIPMFQSSIFQKEWLDAMQGGSAFYKALSDTPDLFDPNKWLLTLRDPYSVATNGFFGQLTQDLSRKYFATHNDVSMMYYGDNQILESGSKTSTIDFLNRESIRAYSVTMVSGNVSDKIRDPYVKLVANFTSTWEFPVPSVQSVYKKEDIFANPTDAKQVFNIQFDDKSYNDKIGENRYSHVSYARDPKNPFHDTFINLSADIQAASMDGGSVLINRLIKLKGLSNKNSLNNYMASHGNLILITLDDLNRG